MVYREEVFAFENDSSKAPAPSEQSDESNIPETVKLVIAPGSIPDDVGEQLEEMGLVNDKEEFLSEVTRQEASGKIVAGTYEMSAGLGVDEIVKILTESYSQ